MHMDRHREVYLKLAPKVSPALLEQFWRLQSWSFYLDEAPILEDGGVFVIFALQTPIYVCKCEFELDELAGQYATILSGKWTDANDVNPRNVRRQRWTWETYLDHAFDDSDIETGEALLPLECYRALFLSVDSATDRAMWTSLLISTLRPICNIEVFDDAEVDAVVQSDLSDPPTEQQMLKLVTIDGRYIRYVDKPDEALQILAVKKTPWALAEILNVGISPSQNVFFEALKGDGLTLKLIKEPDRQMQQLAVATDGNAIAYIENPDDELQLIAVNNAPGALGLIAKPCHQAKLSAVGHVPEVITLLDLGESEPDHELLLLAFQGEPAVVRRFRRLPQSSWDYLCRHDPLARLERMLTEDAFDRPLVEGMKETLLPRLLRLLKEGRNTYALEGYLTTLQEKEIEWPELGLIRRAVATLQEERFQRAIDELEEALD